MYHYLKKRFLKAQCQAPCFSQDYKREESQPFPQIQNPNLLSQGHKREIARPPSKYQNLNIPLQVHAREATQLPSQIQNLSKRRKREEARDKREEEAQGTVQNPNLPTLQNVVSTANVGCKLNLKEIAEIARNTEYDPRKFAGLTMRIRNPYTTANIFASGKIVCTGAKSEELSKIACRKFARILQKLGNDVKFKDFKIQNVVASFNCRFPINVEKLAISAHQKCCSYEPELFTGLRYHMKEPKVDILLFVSGNIVLTGGKTREQLYEAFEKIHPVLMEFRRP